MILLEMFASWLQTLLQIQYATPHRKFLLFILFFNRIWYSRLNFGIQRSHFGLQITFTFPSYFFFSWVSKKNAALLSLHWSIIPQVNQVCILQSNHLYFLAIERKHILICQRQRFFFSFLFAFNCSRSTAHEGEDGRLYVACFSRLCWWKPPTPCPIFHNVLALNIPLWIQGIERYHIPAAKPRKCKIHTCNSCLNQRLAFSILTLSVDTNYILNRRLQSLNCSFRLICNKRAVMINHEWRLIYAWPHSVITDRPRVKVFKCPSGGKATCSTQSWCDLYVINFARRKDVLLWMQHSQFYSECKTLESE